MIAEPGYIAQELKVALAVGESLTLEKTVAFFTSRDQAISESGTGRAQSDLARPALRADDGGACAGLAASVASV